MNTINLDAAATAVQNPVRFTAAEVETKVAEAMNWARISIEEILERMIQNPMPIFMVLDQMPMAEGIGILTRIREAATEDQKVSVHFPIDGLYALLAVEIMEQVNQHGQPLNAVTAQLVGCNKEDDLSLQAEAIEKALDRVNYDHDEEYIDTILKAIPIKSLTDKFTALGLKEGTEILKVEADFIINMVRGQSEEPEFVLDKIVSFFNTYIFR